MTIGDFVIFTADPLMYGRMIIVDVTANALLICEAVHADRHGDYARDIFDPHELELAARWAVA